jgi:hypothetical protein
MKQFLLATVAFATLSACTHYDDKTDKSAENALNKWVAAMESRNTSNVVGLYDDDAVLIATFAKKPIINQKDRTKYFDDLLKHHNLKVKVTELYTDRDGDIAMANGLYTFSFKENGKTVEVPARFTFVFEHEADEDRWEIESHHSSLLPK